MASISTLQASSSSSNPHTYDVFLSFRGEDTRKTFTGHLYANLVANGIHTFRDDEELEKGGDIASDLSRAIEESKIFVIIFSKRYADSKWCLNELVKIIDCKTEKGSVVLPVFYHVEPTDVRKQGGSFKDAFLDHAKDADQEKEKTIETWKNALMTAANLSGFHHLQNQSEADFIQSICEDIITRLNRKPLHVGDNIVGMDFHLEQLKSLIKTKSDEVHMVGIYGTGGIGKSTISMAIYNGISSQFDGSSFLENVGGQREDGLLKLQKRLLQDTLNCNHRNKPEFNSIREGINVIKQRLRLKRVLIVLEYVDDYMQLENLAGKYGWYGAKSIIIITTKDKHLLELHEVNEVYEVQKLNHEKSVELFNWWAFKQNTPIPKFESLSDSIVKYADGLPIALRVLGGFLFKKSTEEWESELQKLQEMPDRKVQSVLKVSYDKLDGRQKAVFLDIACFFRGEDKNFVSRILGSGAKVVIKVLEDRCLITISENILNMHDLLQQMGREVVRQEGLKESHIYPQEPGKRSRLWDPKDVESVLTRNTGTEAIEGLFVGVSTSNQIQFSTKFFVKMKSLRLLKVYHMIEDDFEVDLPEDFEIPSFELRYLHFEGYPLQCLPRNFHAKNLVELDLIDSSIKQLWKENEILDKLKVINLSDSKDLVEIPDFSSVPNLEILILEGCTRLHSLPRNFHKLEHLQSLSCSGCSKLKSFPKIKGNMSKLRKLNLGGTPLMEVPSSIGHLKALQHLDLSYCKSLRSLSESICNLSSLKTLILGGCSNLKGFPEIKDDMENLKMLDLSFTSIEELPSSIGRLKALQNLDLCSCKSLRSLSNIICNLSSLETLILDGCSSLKGFPEIKDDMKNLKRLNLTETGIEELPSSIGHLKALQRLDLSRCKSLRSLPESICNLSSLETLTLCGCSNLKGFPEIISLGSTGIEELPSSIGHLKALKHLGLSRCKSLRSLPESICNLSSLETLILEGCSYLKGFPEIKDDMENLKKLYLSETGIEELPSSIGRLRALQHLDLSRCKSLRSLPESICNLSSLETLILERCSYLKGFPEIKDDMENLKRLDLRETGIEELPSSIGRLKALKHLNLKCCTELVSLPDSICNLSSLETLILEGCSYLKGFPEIKDDMENLEKLYLSETGIEELPSSIGRLRALQHLDLSRCKSLRSLPESICNLSSLETLILEGCSYLKGFPEIKDDMENLKRLDLKETGIEELPSSIGRLKALKHLNLICCAELVSLPDSICNLSSLETLILEGCSYLKGFPEIKDDMENLEKLYLSETGIEELPSSIGRLRALQHLDLSRCKSLRSLPESICNLSSLETLILEGCSYLKGFPEIKDDMENLKRLDLKETGIEELPSSIGRLKALKHLNLICCAELVSLPDSICNLSSLETLILEGCSYLKGFPEIKDDMENLEKLYLSETGIEELPSSIGRLRALQHLDLSRCKSLRSLPESICNLSSLETLILEGCSYLKGFPEIKDDMENLKRLDLKETGIEELPSSIGRLKALKHLNLICCAELVSLPDSIFNLSSLEALDVRHCPKLERVEVNLVGSLHLTLLILKQRVIWWSGNLRHAVVEGEVLNHHVSSLSSLVESCTRDYRGIYGDRFHLHAQEVLSVGNFSPIQRGILSDIFRQSSLKIVSPRNCNLMEEGIPSDIWNLSSLVNLSLSNCSLTEGEILNHICHISSLQNLSLDGNHFSSIPANIIQLSKLRSLHLHHCLKLLQIPELPPSLRVLDVHACPCLETLSSPSTLLGLSLFKCFESAIEERSYWPKKVEILMPGNNGIPEWISHKKKGSEIVVELPENWWEDNNFLGFALCSVLEFNEHPCYFKLHFHRIYFDYPYGFEFKYANAIAFSCSYPCCRNGGESNRVWVAAYYPKVAIENKHWSNEFRHLKATFDGELVKVEECGLHLIYKTNILNRDSNATNHWPRLLSENTDFNVKRSLNDAENPHNKKSRLL